MWSTLILLLLAWPLGIGWTLIVERVSSEETRGGWCGDLQQRFLHIFGRGLITSQTSWRQVVITHLLLVGWLCVAGSLVWSLTASPEEEAAAGSIGILILLLCGLLECFRLMAADGKPTVETIAAVFRQGMVWLTIGFSLAGAAVLSGSLGWRASAVMQASSGVWTAVIQPLGMIGFVGAVLMSLPARTDVPELVEETKLCCLAMVVTVVYCGGWHFWGLAAYTNADDLTFSALFLRGLVVLIKTAVIAGGLVFIREKIRTAKPVVSWDVIESRLLPLAGVNLLIAVTGSTWLGPEDTLSRSLLSWIVIFGAAVYAVLFHRSAVTKSWKLSRG